jgi:hypothetical protein
MFTCCKEEKMSTELFHLELPVLKTNLHKALRKTSFHLEFHVDSYFTNMLSYSHKKRSIHSREKKWLPYCLHREGKPQF